MRYPLIACLLFAGCSGSPTAPTIGPTTTTSTPPPVVSLPPVATAPPVVAPPVVTPPVVTPNPLLSDPRFDLNFYRMFALGGRYGLNRWTQPPQIYLRTVDDAGKTIDAYTLNETAAALINTAGSLTGAFGIAGLEQGTDTREGQQGWLTVRWSDRANGTTCGTSTVGGNLINLYPKTTGCRCSGGPQVTLTTIRHELGHSLGYFHTDSPNDLMHYAVNTCDKRPSEREVFHARVAYSQPLGSLDPR